MARAYPLAAGRELHGRRAVALAAWSLTRYVPDKPMALLLLGITPFMARLLPSNIKPDPDRLWQGTVYGTICMGLMLMTGVSGPLLDTFFLGGDFGRREKVATKAMCQLVSHFTKLVYFGGIIDQAASLDPVLAGVAIAASMLGTTLARRILEAMTDQQFVAWSNKLITTIACYYIAYGGWLLLVPRCWRLSTREVCNERDGRPAGAGLRRMGRARAARLCRGDRDLEDLMPASHDLGRRRRARLRHPRNDCQAWG